MGTRGRKALPVPDATWPKIISRVRRWLVPDGTTGEQRQALAAEIGTSASSIVKWERQGREPLACFRRQLRALDEQRKERA